SHVEVLRRLRLEPEPGTEITLINPNRLAAYSGMLPGLIAGHYPPEACHIDLAQLALATDFRFVQSAVTGLHPDARLAFCENGESFAYDVVSIDVGSKPGTLDVTGAAQHTLSVKPTERFLQHWDELLDRARRQLLPAGLRMVVVGGGAAGVETLLAMQHRLREAGAANIRFALVTDTADLLPTHPARVRRIFRRVLAQRDVALILGGRVARITRDVIVTASGARIDSDLTVWATGASAPFWPHASGLLTDANGFIRVNRSLQSVNRPEVFASGDIASMDGAPRHKSGVYAVRQGPPLTENLRRALRGESLVHYRPQPFALALISTGDRYAVASRGAFAIEGAWVWRWKDWIDRKFISRYRLDHS
ncbi:MAG: FAD-dependent oxidoreductase, partial [Candidatus Binataceae bacterium]